MSWTNISIQAALILAVFGVLYLALVLPQQRKLKWHKMMLASLQTGNMIATTGGLVGTVVGIDNERTVTVEIAENIRVTIIRDKIDEVFHRTQ